MPELKTFNVKANTIRSGDFLIPDAGEVDEVTSKTKWTTIELSSDGVSWTVRYENDAYLDVQRPVPTEEKAVTEIIKPDFDSAVELSPYSCWYLVTVDWEYDTEVYVMSSAMADATPATFKPRIAEMPRDEGFVITDVKLIR